MHICGHHPRPCSVGDRPTFSRHQQRARWMRAHVRLATAVDERQSCQGKGHRKGPLGGPARRHRCLKRLEESSQPWAGLGQMADIPVLPQQGKVGGSRRRTFWPPALGAVAEAVMGLCAAARAAPLRSLQDGTRRHCEGRAGPETVPSEGEPARRGPTVRAEGPVLALPSLHPETQLHLGWPGCFRCSPQMFSPFPGMLYPQLSW